MKPTVRDIKVALAAKGIKFQTQTFYNDKRKYGGRIKMLQTDMFESNHKRYQVEELLQKMFPHYAFKIEEKSPRIMSPWSNTSNYTAFYYIVRRIA